MMRLRSAFLLLIVLPALIFLAGSLYVARWSHAALEPELDRHAAARAVEYLRLRRSQLATRLSLAPEQLARRATGLGIERLATYGTTGQLITTFPDTIAIPLSPGGEQTEAMLAAAGRGRTVAELVRLDGRTLWLVYVPGADRLAIALLRPLPDLLEHFTAVTGYELALYLGDALALASGDGWPEPLPAALSDSLASFDRPLSTRLRGVQAAAAPVKDFDDWEMAGALIVRGSDAAPSIPPLPLWPLGGLILGALLSVIAVWRTALRPTLDVHTRRLQRGIVLALIPPALAAAWLASADGRASAGAGDAALELGARVTGTVADPTTLSAERLAWLTGAAVAVLADDSLVAAHAVELSVASLLELRASAGRVHVGERMVAYRAVAQPDGTRLFLFSPPLEDSRKAALFWLAGLYGLFAVGLLVFASLVHAAGSAMEYRETISAWAFVAPSVILLLVFSAAPLLFAFYLSFHGWNLLEPAKPFVALRHYVELASDGLFWNAAKNTAIYSLYVPATMVCALAVAILLNRSIKGVALLRAVFFLPYITSFVAISIVWQWMYDPDFGIFNWALGLLGLGPFPWLNSPSTALLALIIMAVWIHIGFQMVIFLAGLQAIPAEFYEAAMIDGAGPWRRFWNITLPMLRPTTFFVLVTSIIGSFQVFTFVYVMTEGGPLHATDVIVYHIYQNAWQFLRMGYASAMSWILFAVIFAITLLQFRLLGRRMTPS